MSGAGARTYELLRQRAKRPGPTSRPWDEELKPIEKLSARCVVQLTIRANWTWLKTRTSGAASSCTRSGGCPKSGSAILSAMISPDRLSRSLR